MGDYIKLHRSLLKWEWFQNPNTLQVWLYCLCKANWKPGRFQGVAIPRGSFATSYAHISVDTGLTPKQIRVALQHLEQTGEITKKRAKNFSIITVAKWALFQGAPENEGRPRADRGQTEGRQRATIEEDIRSNKNVIKKEITPPNPRSIADRLTAEEWGELEKRLSNDVIINLIDEADAKGVVIEHPYAYLITMAQNKGVLTLWK